MKTFLRLWQYLAEFFFELKMSQIIVVVYIKTHFTFSNFFFPKNRAVYEIIWKNLMGPERRKQ